jgi:hypothetical protein
MNRINGPHYGALAMTIASLLNDVELGKRNAIRVAHLTADGVADDRGLRNAQMIV